MTGGYPLTISVQTVNASRGWEKNSQVDSHESDSAAVVNGVTNPDTLKRVIVEFKEPIGFAGKSPIIGIFKGRVSGTFGN